MTPFKPEVIQAMEACRSHAKDLFRGATLLREQGLPHLAYHLATLTLEELGKAQLIGMKSFSKEDSDSWYGKQFGDHIKKLFWAIWLDVFGKRPDPKELEQLRGTATLIHNNRLRGLYVEASDNFVAPKDLITDELLAPLMDLAEAKLALQPSMEGAEYRQEDLDLLGWFSNATDDPERRKFIFSQASFDKMAVIGPREWLKWVHDENQRMAAEAMAVLQQEMTRGVTQGPEGQHEKWELKIRLFSQSHSIHPKSLNRWNDQVTWIKLHAVSGKKNYIDATFKLPKFIPMNALYFASYGFSNLLLASLNIASGGFFWWHEPINLSAFYESFVDKENQMTGQIGRSPALKIGWPPAVLDDAILDQVVWLFSMMPQPYHPPEDSEALNHYITAIAFWAKTDVFLQFELYAYGEFLTAITVALRLYRNDLGAEFPETFATLLSMVEGDNGFKKKHLDLSNHYGARTVTRGVVTLSEVGEIKRICDGLFKHVFSLRMQNRLRRDGGADTKAALADA